MCCTLGFADEQAQRSTSRERNRVTISISVAPPMPTFPSPHSIRRQQRSRLARAVRQTIRDSENPPPLTVKRT